jgi:ABC-type uncharacterized transport system fused permease/ATPase subunit
MVDDTQQTTRPTGDPIGPGFFRTARRVWGTKMGRRTIVLGVGLIIVSVLIVVGLVIFSAMSRESQSYRDGYSIGGTVYGSDAYAQADAQQACKKAELRGPGQEGLPSGDDQTQWLKGCVAAFATAQSGD